MGVTKNCEILNHIKILMTERINIKLVANIIKYDIKYAIIFNVSALIDIFQ